MALDTTILGRPLMPVAPMKSTLRCMTVGGRFRFGYVCDSSRTRQRDRIAQKKPPDERIMYRLRFRRIGSKMPHRFMPIKYDARPHRGSVGSHPILVFSDAACTLSSLKGERRMTCAHGDSTAITERPERTELGYRRFR